MKWVGEDQVEILDILIVGAGIGGLAAAIALGDSDHKVTVIERDPEWSVYGVGIIQQANVVRAMERLGVLDSFLDAASGFDAVEIFAPDDTKIARIPSRGLVEGRPANFGIGRRELQRVLSNAAGHRGADIRLGLTVRSYHDDDTGVDVVFSDDTSARYDIVIGADGIASQMRGLLFPDGAMPEFTGQAVWRYNLPRPQDMDALQVYNGPIGVGLVPMGPGTMYMFVTTPADENAREERAGMARRMRAHLQDASPAIRALSDSITDDEGVVYRPLETLLLESDWHRGRVVLLGDAVHATTPHLGQGAGMAIEDAIVLAEELAASDTPEQAFAAYRDRRFERCRYIVESSLAICHGQTGRGPQINNHEATEKMFAVVAQPI